MSKSRKARRLEAKQRSRQTGGSRPVPALSRFPQVASGLAAAQQLLSGNRLSEAGQLLDQMCAIEPDNAEIHHLTGVLADSSGNDDAAIDSFNRCLSLAPHNTAATVRLAQKLSGLGDLPGALVAIRNGLKHNPDDPQLHHLAGQLLQAMNQNEDAARHYTRLAELRPQHGAYELVGDAAILAGDAKAARAAFKAAIRHGSRPEHVLAVLARLEAGFGDAEAAVGHLKSALRQAPSDGYAYLQLANDFSGHVDADDLLAKASKAHPISPDAKNLPAHDVPMCFAYARLYELKADYATAFAFYQLANDTLCQLSGFTSDSIEQDLARFKTDNAGFTSDFSGGHDSERPVFVFGLPRSGTTLVEQILASHPDAAGIGEHEAFGWISRYTATGSPERDRTAAELYLSSYPASVENASRVIDKSMSTPEHIATILQLFPHARFIHCRRHPMETGWSMYSMYFGDRSVAYANSFAGIAAQSRAHRDMMAFWHEKLPGRILDIRYDDLIADAKAVTTRMLAHIGLDWHPACEDFHNARNMVRTASITQVRQPIYTSAKAKWRKYEAQLEPLKTMLADSIEDYEGETHGA